VSWPIDAYLEERSLELSPRTIASYRWALRSAASRISKPLSDVTSRDLLELALAWKRNDQLLSHLRTFLRWCGSSMATRVPRGIPPDSRRRLVWYTVAELEAVVDACRTPRERLLIHLACELMFRRIEIERATWDWFKETHVWILGKGRHGGKPRTIPYHPYTRVILNAFISTPKPQINSGGISSNISRPTPASRTTSSTTSKSLPASASLVRLRRSALDKELKRIGARVPLNLQFHALRRTGGRLFVQAGVRAGKHPLQVLNELRGIYGHEDLRTTMRYIGWELEEAGETMALMPSLDKGKGHDGDLHASKLETRSTRSPPARGYGPSGMTVHKHRRTPPTS